MKNLLLLSTLLIFACSSSSDYGADNYSSLIIGTWNGTVLDAEDPTETGNATVTYNTDGTGSDEIVWSKSENTFSTFSWSITSSKIIIDGDEGLIWIGYEFVDDDTLNVFSIIGDRDFSYTFQRVK
jgi:hypothetical protein